MKHQLPALTFCLQRKHPKGSLSKRCSAEVNRVPSLPLHSTRRRAWSIWNAAQLLTAFKQRLQFPSPYAPAWFLQWMLFALLYINPTWKQGGPLGECHFSVTSPAGKSLDACFLFSNGKKWILSLTLLGFLCLPWFKKFDSAKLHSCKLPFSKLYRNRHFNIVVINSQTVHNSL